MSEFENGIAWMIAGGRRAAETDAANGADHRRDTGRRILRSVADRLAEGRRSLAGRLGGGAYRPL